MNTLLSLFDRFPLFGKGLVAFLCLAALVGCGAEDAEVEEEESLQVRVLEIQPKTLHSDLEFTATVVTQNEARVHPEISGTVTEVLVRVGDRVEKGNPLARLDSEKFDLELEVAQAETQRALSEFDRKTTGYRPEEIAATEGVYQNALALHRAKEKNRERNRALFENGSMTERDWTVFQAELAAASAMVQKSSAELSKMLEGYESFDIRSASASLQLAKAREALAEKNLRDTEIRAPISGVVSMRNIEVGELVGMANEVFEIKDTENIWMLSDVSPKDSRGLHVGQQAWLKTDDSEEWVPGFIDRIGNTFKDTTRSMPVWFAFAPGSPLPKVGAYGLARAALDPLEDAIVLRRDWVYLAGGEHYVWLTNDSHLKKQPVRIGKDWGEEALISQGLEPGMKVVVSPPSSFEEGLEVEVQSFTFPKAAPEEAPLSLSMNDSGAN
jgi:multidrug resistance efflux pump